MGWLSRAIWELCISMLPNHNARALLVPILCVALLVPLATSADTNRQSSNTLANAYTEDWTRATVTAGMPVLAHDSLASDPTLSDDPIEQQLDDATAGYAETHLGFGSTAGTPTATTAAARHGAAKGQLKRNTKRNGAGTRPRSQTKSLVLLGRDSSGIVPRKFTIPEPSVVADAEHKHIAMLPAKPYQAAAYEHRLLKRDMLARSGVTLAGTMVVATVDGRMYGVSRYDGAIVWSRECLFESPVISAHGTTAECPRSMVRTKGRSPAALEGGSQGYDSGSESELDLDDSGEEEWLLEQGIDWRSDPQLLQRQRELRREWLNKKRPRPHSAVPGGNSSHTTDTHAAQNSSDELPDILYIAEPGGGGALYMYGADTGLKKLPLTIADLVDQSPVQVRGVLYTGNKEASFAAIDLSTGRLLNVYGDEHVHTNNGNGSGSRDRHHTRPRFNGRRPVTKLLLGEKLNRVRIYPANSKAPGYTHVPQWELHHRALHAPSLDPEIDTLLTEISDAVEALGSNGGSATDGDDDDDGGDAFAYASAHGPTKFVVTHDGGLVMVEASTGIPLWAQEFDAPVVNIFDVFGIATPDNDAHTMDTGHVEYVARRRDLSPAAQQSRYLRWRQLYETDDDVRSRSRKSNGWHTGSAGGNILAGSFWERSGKASSVPQIAYIGKLKDTLYTLTSDEYPLIDHASLTSSLLLALVQAKRDQDRYPEMQTPEWWDRWNFLTHDPIVLRVLQEARTWWLKPVSSESGLALENHFEQLVDMVMRHDEADRHVADDADDGFGRQICEADDRCHYGAIVGIHPLERLSTAIPELEGAPLDRLALPSDEENVSRERYTDSRYNRHGDEEAEALDVGYNAQNPDDVESPDTTKEDAEEWPWWRYFGHYMTRVAALIGYMVTIAILVVFVGAIYLLRPRNKRRPRMWVDAAGEDGDAPGRRARLRISWALMHRMWDTLKEEWHLAIEEAWRNPNAAAVLRRTGVSHRTPPKSDINDANGDIVASPQEHSRVSNASAYSSASSRDFGRFALPRRGSASLSSSSGLGFLVREDSESSLERLPSGMSTPRRNSTGTISMTPLKRSSVEADSIERMQPNASHSNQSQHLRLGAITLTDHVLGYGSHGTVVYRGEFQGRAVAVKRLLLDFYDVADHEVQVLQESDSHPNVIRYYCTERRDHFMYIALELCCGSLADAVVRSPKAALASQLLEAIPKKRILHQLACGLHHLHALKLVHRDIKPQNILIAPPPHRRRRRKQQQQESQQGTEFDSLAFEDTNIVAGGMPRVLISDFGLSRILDDDESSFANTFTMHGAVACGNGNGLGAIPGGLPPGMIGGIGGGTVGWRAPECFDSPETRVSLGKAAAPTSNVDVSNGHPPRPLPGAADGTTAEEPGPYASRGTRSRLRHLAMYQKNPDAKTRSSPQNQQQAENDDPDSIGTSLHSSTDPTGFAAMHGSSAGSRRRMTRAVDVFSMGCVFYYVLMGGEHPFGDRLSREQRILIGTPDLRPLEASENPSAIEAVDLVAHMVARAEQDRPSAASVLVHPYFWDASQRLAFLQDVSDCLEAEARLIKAAREDVAEPPKKVKTPKKKGAAEKSESHAIPSDTIENIIAQLPIEQAAAVRRAMALLDAFEDNSAFVMESAPPAADGFQVVGLPPNYSAAVEAMGDAVAGRSRPRRVVWDRRLDPHLRRDLGKFRKYDGTRLRDLLRIIRNKKNHYQDMPMPLRETLGDIPDGYLHYFESRFPYLLLHCYYFVLEDDSLRTATIFRPYFRAPSL
ncbi:bifunctional endoribonuclease/protein kinase ire1 [Coemansia guatemalensis]|uniref:non-specific serine/threonine protein kinase n=1 Tax=Coemansia guatemalensis TaxID=2761395 RepID=A0A9W8HT57_9FUNG|nr:bifunctional endoribonuclease/protein kinase ire1 [Coemansia guatemalensis]